MRVICLLIGLLLLGCKNVEVRKVSEADIVRSELNQMDWGNVDTYPAFEDCRESSSPEEQKHCFGEKFANYVLTSLSEHEFILNDSLHEEIQLVIQISDKGKAEIEGMEISPELEEKVEGLRTWLEEAVADLPKIYPAEKRGVPVATKFKLPLIIETD